MSPVRVMLDTDDLAALDGNFELLATYADLIKTQANLSDLQDKFPDSILVFIDRGLGDPLDIATVADIEPKAMTVDQLPAWVAHKRAKGLNDLTGYCDRNDLPAVVAIERHGLYHWVATLDGTAFIAGYKAMHAPAAVQLLGAPKTGVHADVSLVYENSWHNWHTVA